MAVAPSIHTTTPKAIAKKSTGSAPVSRAGTSAKKTSGASAEDKRATRAAERMAVAAARKASDEGDRIAYETTKCLVPMWFGMHSVRQGFKKNRSLPPEAALCLMLIGSGAKGESEVGMQFRLRPSGFDREEAALLATMGTASLFGAKLAKRVKPKQGETTKDVLQLNVLTAKGQKLYELVKQSLLASM